MGVFSKSANVVSFLIMLVKACPRCRLLMIVCLSPFMPFSFLSNFRLRNV